MDLEKSNFLILKENREMKEDECVLCNGEVEMMFSTIVQLEDQPAMLTAPICLKCWSAYEDDTAVVKAIMEKTQAVLNERK